MERPSHVEVYAGTDAKWRWRVRAANGQITATSGESFFSRENATRAVREVLRDALPSPEIRIIEEPEEPT